jgi:GTPase
MTKRPTANPDQLPPRAIVVSVHAGDSSSGEAHASLLELEALLQGLDIEVVDRVVQRRATQGSLGSGRLAELAKKLGAEEPLEDDAALLDAEDDDTQHDDDVDAELSVGDADESSEAEERAADMVVFDGELGPGEARRIERVLGVEVLDRTQIILRVFQERARTPAAQLEIELAQLTYEAPRLRDKTSSRGRVGGGGRGGKGHTGVQLSKQKLRERMAVLRRELEELHRLHNAHKARRAGTSSVALVGYTNAGKSSLMRALTGSDVLVQDQLFATLGTTVRALQPETQPRILISDTVGFIRNLPHALLASFRATLAEAHDADLLLLVVDAADPELNAQLQVTREVLKEIGAADIPSRLVLNKLDKVTAERRDELLAAFPEAIALSAHSPSDVAALREKIIAFFSAQLQEVAIQLPYAKLALVADVRKEAQVVSETYSDEGVALQVRGSAIAVAKLERLLGPALSRGQ